MCFECNIANNIILLYSKYTVYQVLLIVVLNSKKRRFAMDARENRNHK